MVQIDWGEGEGKIHIYSQTMDPPPGTRDDPGLIGLICLSCTLLVFMFCAAGWIAGLSLAIIFDQYTLVIVMGSLFGLLFFYGFVEFSWMIITRTTSPDQRHPESAAPLIVLLLEALVWMCRGCRPTVKEETLVYMMMT